MTTRGHIDREMRLNAPLSLTITHRRLSIPQHDVIRPGNLSTTPRRLRAHFSAMLFFFLPIKTSSKNSTEFQVTFLRQRFFAYANFILSLMVQEVTIPSYHFRGTITTRARALIAFQIPQGPKGSWVDKVLRSQSRESFFVYLCWCGSLWKRIDGRYRRCHYKT